MRPVSAAPDAKNVIFLSADAFGVLPPVSILTPEQTKYYFLSGFTAKLAGTERGITEPTPTFSACFGQAFLELHPTKYAEELVKKMEKSGAKAYLVNTGWNGTGKRISIKDTRGIIDAILNGSILKAPTKKIPHFDFEVPTELPGVDSTILDPRDTYADASQWDDQGQGSGRPLREELRQVRGQRSRQGAGGRWSSAVIHWFSQGCAFGRAPFPLSIFFGGETPCPSSFAGPGRETICSFGSFSRKLPRCTTKAVLTFFRKKAGFIPRRNLPGCWLDPEEFIWIAEEDGKRRGVRLCAGAACPEECDLPGLQPLLYRRCMRVVRLPAAGDRPSADGGMQAAGPAVALPYH